MIDRTALLATLKPVVGDLENSIRERALATPEVAAHLELEHSKAVKSDRTAMSLEEWREGEITQAAAAWVLACVFVRFLEDNRLIAEPLISGPGPRGGAALGHRSVYFQRDPGHSDREYLESCFREVAAFPAVAPLYDARHNPLWRLEPTADGARALRETFTAIHPTTGDLVHDFSDADLDTRFLGDLYQDLSDAARKRYALLQTPDFVEFFILDRTLTPAIAEFGLDEVRLIDPTCGSGHFLIGAFHRLFALWQEREPGTTATVLAQRALDQIAGVDLNPYASAIARFRLVIAALKACNIVRLAEAPAFSFNLATGDSLLHGPLPFEGAATLLDAGRLDKNIAHVYESEDADELKRILGRGYHAVVGNPPYISVQDSALRDAYRARYATCKGQYVLTVPFMERFFELAQLAKTGSKDRGGFVGKITGNNFMKRDFGVPLVEQFLPSVDIQTVIDVSGAYVPGHGTPTVILFGRSRAPFAERLRVLDGVRGEPSRPDVPSQGYVWRSISALVDLPGHQDRFIRSSDIERGELFIHPMSLGVGRELKARLQAGRRPLGDLIADSGRTTHSGSDEAFYGRTGFHRTLGVSDQAVPLVTGDAIRDWSLTADTTTLFPYHLKHGVSVTHLNPNLLRILWPRRRVLETRIDFGQTPAQRGLRWFEHSMFFAKRYCTPRSIAWAFVATHNHFVLDRGGKVFKQTAPVLTLHEEASDDEHLALLGVLNSSVVCFWFKQTGQNRGDSTDSAGARVTGVDAWVDTYEISTGRVKDLPLPSRRSPVLAAELDRLASEQTSLLDGLGEALETGLGTTLNNRASRDIALGQCMITLQEELDWQALAAYGLASNDLSVLGESAPPIRLGERAFEIVLARQVAAGETETKWFERHGSTPITEVPAEWPQAYRAVVERRIALIESNPDVGLIERPEHKRRWSRAPWEARVRVALTTLVLDALETPELWDDLRPRSTAELTDHLRKTPLLVEALEILATERDAGLGKTVERLVTEAAVPHLAAQRLTEKGLAKRAVWERVWELQRAEDRGEEVGSIPVPPKYAQGDFRSGVYWKQRGKLDVPKERFVLIPNAQRGADMSPVIGWAGWDERDLARALAGRITELREQDAADAERVTPLLAGVLELLPWIHQWHPDTDSIYAGPPGAFFEGWLDGQLAELSITRVTLRAWRPPAPTRGRKAKVTDA